MIAHFWLRIHPLARRQLNAWETLATAIPDPRARGHALATLRDERLSAMGAALVAATARPYSPDLVRLLVALQIAWDYIDTLAEQPAPDPVGNGVQLHRALLDAVAETPIRGGYHRLHPGGDDGGYLQALVMGCRQAGARLPAFPRVRSAVLEELRTAEVQYAHHAAPAEREARLHRWAAERETQESEGDMAWFELAAAASSSLGVLALLALAADRGTDPDAVARRRAVYSPWVDALTALLDSFVDRDADARAGLASWMDHYPTDAAAAERLADVVARVVREARALPDGGRHLVVVTGMLAMHLSQPTAWLPGVAPATRALLRAADTPVMGALLVLLRAWRGVRSKPAYADGGAVRSPAPTPTGQLTPVPPSPQ